MILAAATATPRRLVDGVSLEGVSDFRQYVCSVRLLEVERFFSSFRFLFLRFFLFSVHCYSSEFSLFLCLDFSLVSGNIFYLFVHFLTFFLFLYFFISFSILSLLLFVPIFILSFLLLLHPFDLFFCPSVFVCFIVLFSFFPVCHLSYIYLLSLYHFISFTSSFIHSLNYLLKVNIFSGSYF